MSALQTKLNLLEQTVRLEEEERQRDLIDDEEKQLKVDKEKQIQAAAAEQLKSRMMLQKEEAERQKLLNDVIADPSVPRSLVKLLQEQTGKMSCYIFIAWVYLTFIYFFSH